MILSPKMYGIIAFITRFIYLCVNNTSLSKNNRGGKSGNFPALLCLPLFNGFQVCFQVDISYTDFFEKRYSLRYFFLTIVNNSNIGTYLCIIKIINTFATLRQSRVLRTVKKGAEYA